MRLFVAVEVPDATRDALAERAREVRSELPKARWVRPGAMHLTLAFLGETDEELLPALDRELAPTAAAVTSFELRLGRLGAFPPRGKARVLWAGFAGATSPEPPDELLQLHQGVARAVHQAAGIPPESRPFHPHLTLARLQPPWGRADVERFLAAFGEPPATLFRVTHGVLFRSELHPSGARYQALRRFSLADAPGGAA